MKPGFAAIVAALFVALLLVPPARADVFVAGGDSISSPAPFEVLADKQEVCAPAVAALRHLGVQVTASDSRIEMRAPNGSSVVARLGRDRALVGGAERLLPAPLERRGEDLYFPVRTIAWHLDLAYRWDEESRTIFLHPKVADITFARLPDKLRVKIVGTAPLSYSAGMLKQPPRLYVDITNADLFAAEQQIAINEADLIGVRASQHTLNPDVVRVVLDLRQEPAHYYHSAAEDGRAVVIDLPVPEPAPAPGRVTVNSIALERRSDTILALTVQADGNLVASLRSQRDPPQVIVELSNAQLEQEQVNGDHPLVESATAEQRSENEARIVLNLRAPQRATLARRPNGVRIVVGSVPLSEVTVVLDPGHGGGQPGASGPSGLEEKTINLAVALAAEELLRQEGAQVLMTRRDDSSLIPVPRGASVGPELRKRVELANRRKADVFISVHCNASPRNHRRTGTETYYCTAHSMGLAKIMQQELVKGLGRRDGGVRRRSDLVVIRETNMPAVLLELAYLDDPDEEALLGSPEFRQRAAEAVVSGVRRFVEEGGLLDYYAERESAAEEAPSERTTGSTGAAEEPQ